MLNNKSRTQKFTYTALFVALIIAGTFIRIPIPVMPFTLQTLFTALAGLMLGPLYGGLAVAIYIVLGLLGLPIFAAGGGFAYVLMPSFGYMIGFLIGAVVEGFMVKAFAKKKFYHYLIASLINTLIVYGIGMFYFYMISTFYLGRNITAKTILVNLFLILILPDIVKATIAALCAYKLNPILFASRVVRDNATEAPEYIEDTLASTMEMETDGSDNPDIIVEDTMDRTGATTTLENTPQSAELIDDIVDINDNN